MCRLTENCIGVVSGCNFRFPEFVNFFVTLFCRSPAQLPRERDNEFTRDSPTARGAGGTEGRATVTEY